ncbi:MULTISPECIES: RICIN domain-containing protein [unclassified Streptomyces]|uniref:RICIN domain-containing protein n=1 Tax=unclassified Streptomyces TaxID=2593676 RepID=UPI003822B827
MHTSRRLTATASAICLAAAGLALVPAGAASASGAPQGGHVYALTAAHSGKNAAVRADSLADGATVVQKTASGVPGQLWKAVGSGRPGQEQASAGWLSEGRHRAVWRCSASAGDSVSCVDVTGAVNGGFTGPVMFAKGGTATIRNSDIAAKGKRGLRPARGTSTDVA